jgi:hypothetical protein
MECRRAGVKNKVKTVKNSESIPDRYRYKKHELAWYLQLTGRMSAGILQS